MHGVFKRMLEQLEVVTQKHRSLNQNAISKTETAAKADHACEPSLTICRRQANKCMHYVRRHANNQRHQVCDVLYTQNSQYAASPPTSISASRLVRVHRHPVQPKQKLRSPNDIPTIQGTVRSKNCSVVFHTPYCAFDRRCSNILARRERSSSGAAATFCSGDRGSPKTCATSIA